LAILAERPANGYQIIQDIEERSRGGWKPSPGSIYPTLAQLEDEGLVRAASDEDGRRLFEVTEAGNDYVSSHLDEVSAPWEAFAAPEDDDDELRPILAQTAAALWQVMATGTTEQQARARDVLADTRRKLYGILADGDDDGGDSR
jgi:DNA-binding PadR family transcriptional regulator